MYSKLIDTSSGIKAQLQNYKLMLNIIISKKI